MTREQVVEEPVEGEELHGDDADHDPGDGGRQEVDGAEDPPAAHVLVQAANAMTSGMPDGERDREQEQRVVLEHAPEGRVAQGRRCRREGPIHVRVMPFQLVME